MKSSLILLGVVGAYLSGSAGAEAEHIMSTGGNWAQKPPPTARSSHTAIYDPLRDRMVVFGGNDGSNRLNEVWALSLAGSPQWTQLTPEGTAPSARQWHTAIYDPVRDRMVVFGGHNGSFMNDVWELSLAGSPGWTQLAPAGTPPSGRWQPSAIYDPVRDRMVVFGGLSNTGLRNDVWVLSLAGSLAWTQLTPAGTPPSTRSTHTAIYDPVRDRMVVFGGDRFGNRLNDVWELSLAGSPGWTQLTPAGPPPSARSGHTAIYDPVRDRMMVFGGSTGTNFLNEVWELSLAGSPGWTQVAPSGTPPSARFLHTAIYDPVRDRMVVFGGGSSTSSPNEVWALSLPGSPEWTELTPGTPPIGRSGHTAIYDPVRERMVVFGGFSSGTLNDVWALSLAGSPEWTQIISAGTPPSARHLHTAIYDPVRDRMVVFGGYGSSSSGPIYLNDVWELSLAGSPAWTQITPAGTPPITRRQHTAIYDPIRDRMVVFGGAASSAYRNDVWALSLAGSPAWTVLTPAGSLPQVRYGHTAIYDPIRDRMVVFGGGTNSIPPNLNDVRSLSLAGSPAWTLLTPAGTPPSARYGHEAIYDPVRDRMVVFGGYNGTSSWNDVWELSLADSPGWTQLAPAGTPPSARYWHRAIYDPVRDHMAVFGGNDGSNNRSDVWYLKWASTVSVPPRSGDDALWLAPAYPNPSRSGVSIGFTLPRASEATLRIYDVSGRVVMTLVDGWLPAGSQTIRWDRRSSSGAFAQPGLYFYELRVNGQKLARRMVLIQ